MKKKEYVTMKKIENSVNFEGVEIGDFRFTAIAVIFDPFIKSGELIEWLMDEKKLLKVMNG